MAEYSPSNWESSKENVQPLRTGRKAECLSSLVQPSSQDLQRLVLEKQKFEEEILVSENSSDPLDPWDRYLNWTQQNFPTDSPDNCFTELLQKFVGHFLKSERYKNDPRFVNAWILICERTDDPFTLYSFMKTNNIGSKCAAMYVSWSSEYEKIGDMKRAEQIYKEGEDMNAQPFEYLQQQKTHFEMRFARHFMTQSLKTKEESDQRQMFPDEVPTRTAMSSLQGMGRRNRIGTQRTGHIAAGSKPMPFRTQIPHGAGEKANRPIEIFEDDAPQSSVAGMHGQWTKQPQKDDQVENNAKAGKWTDAKQKQTTNKTSLTMQCPEVPQSNFVVYQDTEEPCPSTAQTRTVANNVEQILRPRSKDKPTYRQHEDEFNQLVNGAPVEEPGYVRMYDVEKVYSVLGEMEFPQIRAAFWRQKQSKIEIEKMESEVTKKRQELMDKLKKLEEQKDVVDKALLEADHDDITVQVNAIKQKNQQKNNNQTLHLVDDTEEEHEDISHHEQTNFVSNCVPHQQKEAFEIFNEGNDGAIQPVQQQRAPAIPSNTFAIYSDNATDHTRPHSSMFSAPSNNSSLNFSKRSQPSPTVHTKVATGEVMNWLQSSIGEANSIDSFCSKPAHNTSQVNTFNEPLQPTIKPASKDFSIYSEDTRSQDCAHQQPLVNHGLFEPPKQDFSIFNEDTQCQNIASQQMTNNRPVEPPKENFLIFNDDNQSDQDNKRVSEPLKNNFPIFDEDAQSAIHHDAHRSAFQPTKNSFTTFNNNRNEIDGPLKRQSAFHAYSSSTQPQPHDAQQSVRSKIPFSTEQKRPDRTLHGEPEKSLFFDEHTVAGSHFAAQARLASTPFTRKPVDEDDCDDHTTDISRIEFGTTQQKPGDVVVEPAQPSQNHNSLSTIMEASNESDRTSSTKSSLKSRTESEGDKTAKSMTASHPLLNDLMPSTPVYQTSQLGGLCNLDDLLSQPGQQDNFFDFLGGNKPGKQTNDAVGDLSESFGSASINTGTGSTVITNHQYGQLNIIQDPWDKDFVAEMLEQTKWRRQPLINMNDSHVNFTKNYVINYGDKSLKISQMIGEGNFAKIHRLSPINQHHRDAHFVLKVQKPACPMEIHALCEAHTRLNAHNLHNVAKSIIELYQAYMLSNASLLLLPYYENGSLLDHLNSTSLTVRQALNISANIMDIVEALHAVKIIHTDIKPDNFLIVNKQTLELKLCDFGRAIDMSLLPPNTAFIASCRTSGFECIQMKQRLPWNYHVDYFGVAGCINVILCKNYIKPIKNDAGSWSIEPRMIKRAFQSDKAMWLGILETLMNYPNCDQPRKPSPLPDLAMTLRCQNTSDDQFFLQLP